VGKVLCKRAYRKIKKSKEGGFDANQTRKSKIRIRIRIRIRIKIRISEGGYASPRRMHLKKQLGGVS
jgi:hypothetical protein